MKTVNRFRLAALVLCGLVAVTAHAGVAIVDTLDTHYEFSGCAFVAVDFTRVGTLATVIADCAPPVRSAQAPGWWPITQPDGGILLWQSRLRLVASGPYAFQACTVIDYQRVGDDENLIAQCLDDIRPTRSARP